MESLVFQSRSLTNTVQNNLQLSECLTTEKTDRGILQQHLLMESKSINGWQFKKCNGVMGVPISFLDKCCPEQFLILGFTGGIGWNEQNDIQTSKEYLNAKQHNPDKTVISGGKVNTGATFLLLKKPDDRYYTAVNAEGYIVRTYGRILIRRKDIRHHD